MYIDALNCGQNAGCSLIESVDCDCLVGIFSHKQLVAGVSGVWVGSRPSKH